MSNAHVANQRAQIQAGEGSSYLWRERVLTVLVVIVAATRAVPECMEQAAVMRLARVWTEWRVWIWRDAAGLGCWVRL